MRADGQGGRLSEAAIKAVSMQRQTATNNTATFEIGLPYWILETAGNEEQDLMVSTRK